ncbi:MAG: polysaccharide deacetylase family protein [Bacteroidetes bacterium]|nr:polysaccharide deacetylase family protein [Bacteroidota bacterium]
MNSIAIYTKSLTARQAYIFDFVWVDVFGCAIQYCDDLNQFKNIDGFKINYSTEIVPADFSVVPHGILFEDTIQSQELHISRWKGLPIFFQTKGAEIPFDIFSAAFYLITRYEEYLPYTPDLYQRFPHENSLAYQHHFLQIPLVDQWLQAFKKLLQNKNQSLSFKKNTFQFIPTYDIDIAYSYLGKGLARNVAASLQNFINGEFSQIKKRIRVLQQQEKDPYDSYDFLDDLHAQYSLNPIYFFLVGKNGRLDKNLAFENGHMQKVFNRISKKYLVGIHPSYQSHKDTQILQSEIAKIKSTRSRQHYIRFTLPTTYQHLIDQGITEDYSMGYGSINGFRASTSFPFHWFNVSKNEVTVLKVYPFCYMECNSFFEQKLTASQSKDEMLHYFHEVQKVEGTLISIWHNFSLGSDPLWAGWREIYADVLQYVSSNK